MHLDKLHHMDCISGMGQLPAESVDLAFADPPFNIGYDYDVYEDRRAAEEYLDWTRQWGRALVRTLKPTGTFWLAIGDDFAAETKLIFQKELGFHCRSWVIWYYTFGVNCSKKFSRSHTHLFHFVRNPQEFKFNANAIRVPSARQLVYADSRADSRGRLPDDTWILRPQDAPQAFESNENTWYFPRVCGTFKERAGWHGCQMPEQLLGRIIKCCSDPGDLVLDPFAGSGTTLVAAKKLGRHYVGFELSANYAKQTQGRIDAAAFDAALAGPADPLASAPPTARVRQARRASAAVTPPPTAAVTLRTEPDDVKRGIVEAFHTVRQGFSADRVVADPELNSDFSDLCKRLGLPGNICEWNERLMNLRKAGVFKGLPRSRRTTFPFVQREYDRYKFACEIAIQRFVQNSDHTVDTVLCDPAVAAKFDSYVLSMLPDKPSSLKIRWFALRLRKAADRGDYFQQIGEPIRLAKNFENPFSLSLSKVPAAPGLYWLSAGDNRLYIGETESLRERFEHQFGDVDFGFGGYDRDSLALGYRAVPDDECLEGHQSKWISEWHPIWNYQKLAS